MEGRCSCILCTADDLESLSLVVAVIFNSEFSRKNSFSDSIPVWTSFDIYLGIIPFAEVLYIKEMTDAASDDHDDVESKKFSHAMQIATRDDGYNSGRIYYLSTESKVEFDDLISDLQKKAKVARVQAEARTSFQKFQLKVRKRYES